jgi:dCTP diphosphatase
VFSAVELEHLRQGLSSRQQATTPCGLVLSLIGEVRGCIAHPAALELWLLRQQANPLNAVLRGQVGDLAKLFAWRSSQAPLTAQDKADVGQDLSAALLQLVRIADACGVDLGRAALDTLTAPAAPQ